jgi:hypothetical protein
MKLVAGCRPATARPKGDPATGPFNSGEFDKTQPPANQEKVKNLKNLELNGPDPLLEEDARHKTQDILVLPS